MQIRIMSAFDKNTDKIAIAIKEFTLLRNVDWERPFDCYSEPYIVSVAIDSSGASTPSIDFNVKPFARVRRGDTITFDGQGHLIYGPKNPGEFVAYSMLFMESDQDVRDFGQMIGDIISSEAINLGLKAILAANPTWNLAITITEKLIDVIASTMKAKKDDELFRRNGTLLRDVEPPYDILRSYIGRNDTIECKTSIIALEQSNMLGKQVETISLRDS